jgi:hypothetical protein
MEDGGIVSEYSIRTVDLSLSKVLERSYKGASPATTITFFEGEAIITTPRNIYVYRSMYSDSFDLVLSVPTSTKITLTPTLAES